MEFTASEMRLIERLRKQDRQWRWARWVLLAMRIFSIAVCCGYAYMLHSVITRPEGNELDGIVLIFILLFWTKGCFFFVFAIWCWVTAWAKWHGDPNRMLLLKLLNEQQKPTVQLT